MDRKRMVFASAFAFAAVAACGGSSTTGYDIATYKELVASVRSAATAYNATMLGPTGADCQRNHDQYDAQARPLIGQMVQMAGEMDTVIIGHGGGASADMKCGAAMMVDELDFHRSIACTFADLNANQAEVARHADAMNSFAYHIVARDDEMRAAIAGSPSTSGGASTRWGAMLNGCESFSSTCCSTMMRAGCCGGLMEKDGMSNGESCCSTGG